MSPTQHEEMRTERTISKIKNNKPENPFQNYDVANIAQINPKWILELKSFFEKFSIIKELP